MTRFLVGRLLLLVVGLLVASIIVFATLRVLPGDVAQIVAGTQSTPAQVEQLRQQLGLDRPVVVQYLDWIGGVLRGDLGRSLVTNGAVGPEIARSSPSRCRSRGCPWWPPSCSASRSGCSPRCCAVGPAVR